MVPLNDKCRTRGGELLIGTPFRVRSPRRFWACAFVCCRCCFFLFHLAAVEAERGGVVPVGRTGDAEVEDGQHGRVGVSVYELSLIHI